VGGCPCAVLNPPLSKQGSWSEFSTGLSEAQRERLAILMEELAEAQQVIGKILRHGFDSTHPDGGPTNQELLQIELGDVVAGIRLMRAAGDIQTDVIFCKHANDKLDRIGKYTHFQTAVVLIAARNNL
jgi:hypothetical protein